MTKADSRATRMLADGATVGVGLLGGAAVLARADAALAVLVVGAAALMDAIDGGLARRAGGPTRRGVVLDVAADLIAFAFAPAAIVLIAHLQPGLLSGTTTPSTGSVGLSAAPVTAGAVAVIGGALVRARRNLVGTNGAPHGWFKGLPMPAVAALYLAVAWAAPRLLAEAVIGCAMCSPGLIGLVPALAATLALTGGLAAGALAISDRRYPSPQAAVTQFPVRSSVLILACLLLTAIRPEAGLVWLALGYTLALGNTAA